MPSDLPQTSTRWKLNPAKTQITGLFADQRVVVLSASQQREGHGQVWQPVLNFGAPADLSLLLEAPDLRRRLLEAEEEIDKLYRAMRVAREALTDDPRT